MYEIWVHFYDPETKQQSMEWRYSGSSRPKKFRVQKSAGKVLASVFWNCHGVIMIDYLDKGRTITGDYYSTLLTTLREKIKEKRRGNLSKGMEKQAEICETYQLKWTSYNSYMHSCISNSLYSDSHADVALVTTDGHQILAHRFVLSYSSLFLSQVLKMYRKVTTALPIMVVLPPEIDHKSLKILVRYMYSGEAKVSKEILEKVLRGGDILQIKGLYREKEDGNGNCKITQNTPRPTPSDQSTPPLLVATTPTPPLAQPPPLVPTTPTASQKTSQLQKNPQSTIVKKTTPTVTTSTPSSTAKIQSSTNSKFIVLQKSKEQLKYANTRQKVLNFTILQNFDKNQKKDDNAKPVTILNKSLGQMKDDNDKTEIVTVKSEPGESNSLQYLMVKNEPIDWSDADMEIIDSKTEIYDDVTVKSEANTEEHSEESNESSDRILEFSPLTCELCTETFTVPAEWVRHVQSHTDMMPAKRRRRDSTGDSYENDTFPELMCDLCQKSFPTPAEWVRHIQNSHSEFELHMSNKKNPSGKVPMPPTSPTSTASTSATSADGYKHCGICNKSFPSHASMVIHQRRHTGEKPYACDVCPRNFNVKSNLLRHLRTLHNKIINSTDVENKETDTRILRRSLPPVPKLIKLSVEEDEEEQKKS